MSPEQLAGLVAACEALRARYRRLWGLENNAEKREQLWQKHQLVAELRLELEKLDPETIVREAVEAAARPHQGASRRKSRTRGG
jgi:hypothetical protein